MYISNKVLYIIQAILPAVAALKVLMEAYAYSYAMPILRFYYS